MAIDLHEITLTPTPAGRGTRVLATKSAYTVEPWMSLFGTPEQAARNRAHAEAWKRRCAEKAARRNAPVQIASSEC